MQPMNVKSAGTALARAIELAGTAVTLVLLAGIALVLLKANNGNDIVHAIRSAADFLAGPFNGMFELDNPRTSIAINWGIAAAVYYAAARVIAGFISRRV
jgi:lysylphosphatidylglycerol synthetase-like protein (DUF2156 family)